MIYLKRCSFLRYTKQLCLCLVICLSIFAIRLSILDEYNRNSEPHIRIKQSEHNRALQNVKETQEENSKPIGPGIIIKHQGDINSVQLDRGKTTSVNPRPKMINHVENVKETQKKNSRQKNGPGIIIKHQGDINSVKLPPIIEPPGDIPEQPDDLGIIENQPVGEDPLKNKMSPGTGKNASIYTFSGGTWQISHACKPYKSYLGNINFRLVVSSSSAGSVKMFVHDPRNDAISSTIMHLHSFEPELVEFAPFLLRKDPKLSLMDIGTNVGLFTMAGTVLGRRVLAVDAVVDNIEHVCASVEYNKFTDHVFLINNTVSNSHGEVSIKIGGIGDFGLSHLNMGDINSKMEAKSTKYFRDSQFVSVDAVKLDEFLTFPRLSLFENILIKIDVEGNEHRVLLGATEFMKKKMKYVKGIIMEWEWVAGGESSPTILKLMSDWKFDAYQCNIQLTSLSLNKIDTWPTNILWLPRDTIWTQ